jgi:Ni,Fe-hydrogenase III large subunit
MTALQSITNGAEAVSDHHPWPRFVVADDGWRRAAEGLRDRHVVLLGYWGEPAAVSLALADPELTGISVVTRECSDLSFPSIAALYPPAARLERTIHDLFGLHPGGAPDHRPWLGHGRWPTPMSRTAPLPGDSDTAYSFLPVEGESLHQIPVGPVHAGIIEPGHFRFTANGEAVVRLEERLGYVHKGVEHLMEGASLEKAARLAGRVSGDSTVAYGIAFARAVEAATGVSAVPSRAHWLRALMAELERIAHHLGDIGAICNDAAFALMHAHCGVLRERVLRTAARCFGHRLMMDRVVPGGVAADLPPNASEDIRQSLAEIRHRLPELIDLYDTTASLQDRTVGTGILRPDLAALFGCGGVIGRASGRAVDMRRRPGYPPYDALSFEVPVRDEGDVDARIWVRICEVEQSLSLIEQILGGLPGGPVRLEPPPVGPPTFREGMALVEGFRGDILVWVRLRPDGTVDRCHPRDPSWFQWPLLEAAIEGNIVADFPLCNKSFNCSYSGHDL